MEVSNELVVIFAAIGAVIFLFLMDYYYRILESRASEERVEVETISDPLGSKERALSGASEPETDEEPDIAA